MTDDLASRGDRGPLGALQRFLSALDAGDWERLRTTYQPDAEIIFPGTPVLDADGLVEVCQHFRQAFPDISHRIATSMVSGRDAAAEIVAEGTHLGSLPSEGWDLEPTGRRVTFKAAQLVTTDGALVTRHHVYYDQVDIMNQLGLMGE